MLKGILDKHKIVCQKSIQRLSSGLRINSAADDASGLSIAEQIKGQIVGYERAYLNVQDGLSMLQVADGATW